MCRAGTAGAKSHLDATVALVRTIAAAHGLRFRLATVESDLPATLVIDALRAGRLDAIGTMPMPTEHEIAKCANIVGQCGTETLRRALSPDIDVLIAGRACDTAIFAALPEMLGFPRGPVMHMAKIIECTSLCCIPGGRDAMLATLDHAGFMLESMHPERHATPASVAAHALYEQADPNAVAEPTGTLYFDTARYEAVDAHRTRVSGARWVDAVEPSIKVEGALRVGHRVVLIAGSVDPGFIAQLPAILPRVEQTVRQIVPGEWQLHPRTYGTGAISGYALATSPSEVGLVIELIAPLREIANAAATVFKQNLLHFGFTGRLSTAGNIAFPFTPPELDAGEAYRFALYHVMRGVSPDRVFKVEASVVG
jgi:Acyclic terpene utilisation family protein AtuA